MADDALAVISAVGIVSPLGRGADETWSALMAGRSGIGAVRSFSTEPFASDRGAEVRADLLPASWRHEDGTPAVGRAEALAVMAIQDALADAGIDDGDVDLVVGTTMGEPTWIETWPDDDARAAPTLPRRSLELLHGTPDGLAQRVARLTGVRGRVTAVGGACAAGNYALAQALDDVRAGRSTRVLAGGVDAFSRTAYLGFAKLGALSPTPCRPFGLDREGLTLGEGAAFLLVESAEAARSRGARSRAALAGAGLSCDAHHPTTPDPEGRGAAAALRAALADAGVGPDEVDWICAHGTGTRANDRAEVAAMTAVFTGRRPPASSLKSLTGHGLGAASAIEAVACVLALEAGVVPPTWGVGPQDPECDWDVVTDGPRNLVAQVVVNQSYAFGGCNAVTVLRRAVAP
ncbi:MAG: beta-ketoacyl-[acyl-carrier-protein] synthase family protein [Actinobacteria bacterium]|nr:beta-ketoacyl-[acyl-carrier-protein] synthase family protein [Actinomycetota bacterium]